VSAVESVKAAFRIFLSGLSLMPQHGDWHTALPRNTGHSLDNPRGQSWVPVTVFMNL